jgi:glycosyltransferase involved in cell wall biosynthesis
MLNWRDPENPLAGGAERVTQGYLAALAARGHEVFWFANDFPGAAPQTTIDRVQILRRGGIGKSIFEARRWYRAQPRFDLVIDQHHGIPWYAPWWCGTNNVSYVHEVLGPIWNAFYPFPKNVIGRAQERWTHRLYRNVPFWTACESTRDDLRRHGVKNISIIRYGVHTVALPELPPKNLPNPPTVTNPLRLIVVSRLAPNKRIDHAIETLRQLLAQNTPAHLTIIGGGDMETPLRAQAATLPPNTIHFTGPLPEPQKDALLREAHFLLHTSQREGWGLNVIEANCMGTPAAVYPVAGLRESTLDNQTGLVSTQETPTSLATRLLECTPTQYQQLRQNAWQRAKKFHWSVILPQACDWLEAQARGQRPVAVPEP